MSQLKIPSLIILFKGISLLCIGTFFKILHWPGAIFLFIIGGVAITAGFVMLSFYFLKGRK
jgi:hypothetical protein